MLWLDAGEVELFLLAYFASDKGQEARRLKGIHVNMTNHESAQLQRLIDALPDKIQDSNQELVNAAIMALGTESQRLGSDLLK